MRRGGRGPGLALGGILSLLSVLCGALLPAAPAGAALMSWHVTPSPSRGGGANRLEGVSCSGPRFCAAVGSFRLTGATLAETWNGRRWSLTPSPNPGSGPDELVAISCPSSSFCAAVGNHSVGIDDLTLIETWNGTRWSISPGPSPSHYSQLLGVSCTSSTDCVAVGFTSRVTPHVAFNVVFVERWNGRAWSVAPAPRPHNTDSQLQAVSCSAASSCTAVGGYNSVSGTKTLAESWNGARWSIVPSPNRVDSAGVGNNALLGVSCTTSKSCEATGSYSLGYAGPPRTLAESWNGAKWSVVSSPTVGRYNNALVSVSCTSATNCVAVGYRMYTMFDMKTLVESWNGSAWSLTSSPNPNTEQQLSAVVCTARSSCKAVGYHGWRSIPSDKTLVETGS